MVRNAPIRSSCERTQEQSTVLERIANGEDAAMGECIRAYEGLIVSLARRHLGHAGDLDDGVQEVFVALWHNAHRYDPARGSELAFIATVAQRRLIDLRRRAGSYQRLLLRAADRRAPTPPPSARRDAAWAEAVESVEGGLRELPDDVERTLRLAVVRGLTYRNVATALGTPSGTIKSWASRGLRRLRERLEPVVDAAEV